MIQFEPCIRLLTLWLINYPSKFNKIPYVKPVMFGRYLAFLGYGKMILMIIGQQIDALFTTSFSLIPL